MIPPPYLLYLGNSQNELSVKTSRGVAYWRPDWSLGEHRGPECTVTLNLPHMDFAEAAAKGARTLIIGVANAGGVLGPTIVADVVKALEAGLHVASGLHERLTEHPEIVSTAARMGLSLFDVREPPKKMAVGDGRPRAGHRLLTVGTDCSVGKMYTTLAIEREMRGRGLLADFRATGQTGIFIAQSGVPIDAVIADFISGGIEAISPARHDGGWDLIEGQGSLFHPSFAGVSLGLLHGAQPDAIVLCHEPGRPHMRGITGRALPDLKDCLEANLASAALTNPGVTPVGIAFNTSSFAPDEARRLCDETAARFNLPCQDPVAMGVDQIVDRLVECFATSQSAQNIGR
ncbi:MAG: N-acetyltransferase DgcN [Phenylobacterium sp.]|uniref:N-acetyltransferase DgcN n=1 Tax=Phenylobacterium sp. TaxID=1871053 RepID=UPI002718FB58|nr:N-acetyltransferase DgcN [Phenylobacterium sp.]MDO8901286.1 N-acetyltransferase DgcN [Phenylobacterium sp.]MDP2212702.1 N-acetyltransferase DgcN [Phenylobacterium sp.]